MLFGRPGLGQCSPSGEAREKAIVQFKNLERFREREMKLVKHKPVEKPER